MIRKPFHTIRQKLMVLLLAVTILPIAISMVISYQATTASVTKNAISNNYRLLSLGKTNTLNYMNNINQKSLAVYNAMNVPQSLYYILEHGMENEVFPNDLTDVIRNRNLLKDHLYNIYQSVSEFHKVRLYVVKQNTTYLLWTDDLKVGKHEEPLDITATKAYIEAAHPSHNYGLDLKSSVDDEKVFTLHRPIIRAPSEELLAELSIDVRLSVLESLNAQLYDAGKEAFYIADGEGRLVLSSPIGEKADEAEAEDSGPGTPLMDKILLSGQDTGHFEWKSGGFDGIVFYDRIKTPFMDWYLIKQTPYKHLYGTANRIAKLNTAVGAGFLAVVVIATLIISIRFTKPLLRLIGYVNKIETGNLGVEIDIETNDEIGLLAKRFRSMMSKINHLIMTEYRLEIASKTNELKALQAQVNPHFLYNALQSIGTVSLHNGDTKAYSLITSLGKLMRYQMNNMGDTVELRRELDYINAYLELQKQRFDTDLAIELKIDDESRNIHVPKMILQPLLENFFKHGFHPSSDEPSRLMLSSVIQPEPRMLIITVSDNGVGMDAERLEELQRELAEAASQTASHSRTDSEDGDSGIGLRNILARLRLQSHQDASMTLAHVEPHGLSVQIQIPLEGSDPR
ncbi:sensor histidine kinase [Paenibacillus sp. LHD-117]|uniref:cache domain-containing sensor histidine kinase n=1 Tax=Paenibacillus sp. LHD-117 TaxID=3071412 RepID=UPI0027DF15B4|nr:sensor histidine kinase [Paenibacillus sp. LHD-117]MDQ6420123.1 sensor histidine kinase [Paenibacillus sp. LHD-117]